VSAGASATGSRFSPLLLALTLPVLAGCADGSLGGPGTGWSRAPDLSVYASMNLYGRTAREQLMLCGGFSPASVRSHWERDFGARESTVVARLIARHGGDAVRSAEVDAGRGVECPEVPDLHWRHQYARLLRLLEMRLGLA
jgi:hypothetical protein